MIKVTNKGKYKDTFTFLRKKHEINRDILDMYGQRGVELLKTYTPKDTGKTANSWSYKIESNPKGIALNFYNSNIQNGVNIAIIIAMGHATVSGTYVDGVDYINPSLKPIFDSLANEMWREIRK